MVYFEENDVLHLSVSDEPETASVELSPKLLLNLTNRVSLLELRFLMQVLPYEFPYWNRLKPGY